MHVLIISPVSSGKLFPAAAKELGMRVSVITSDRGPYQLSHSTRAHIDELVVLTACTPQAVMAQAQRIDRDHPLSGVVPGDEFFVPMTASVSAALGLPGLAPDVVIAVRDKSVMRTRLAEAGVRVPEFRLAHNAAHVTAAGADVGFPCVLKPTTMVGSIGVKRADNQNQLREAYQQVLNETAPVNGARLSPEVVIEQYLRGPEYSVEGYLAESGPVLVGITTKHLGAEPYFQEVGHLVRRAAAAPEYSIIAPYVRAVISALKVDVGAFHAELRLTEDGPALIEIGARLGGDHITALTELATGVSLPQFTIASLTNTSIPSSLRPTAAVAVAGIHYVTEPKLLGKAYQRLRGWGAIQQIAGVFEAAIEIPPGSIIPAQHDFRSRIARVKFTAGSYQAAWDTRQLLSDTLRVI